MSDEIVLSDPQFAPIKTTVSTVPTKRFFVTMLTRDISLEDSILDLLDNCIDGILRKRVSKAKSEGENDAETQDEDETPYLNFYANITFDKNHFEIEDNCGGIPASLRDRAFKLGRPERKPEDPDLDPVEGVGVYGIGMKRAIFKMGGDAMILTQSGEDRYEVLISNDWLTSEGWDLAVEEGYPPVGEDGTAITVNTLYPEIEERFDDPSFKDDLIDAIQGHYSVILGKGFAVRVNGQSVTPQQLTLKVDVSGQRNAIRPYLFQAEYEGVDVFLAVGLRSPIPSIDESLEEQVNPRMSSDEAGWTVICNDRVVVANNKDELTGWGTANIPRYHNQFRSISGVVEFRGDASKLPTTTTKRGLDSSSSLYQQVLNKMRDGLRLFIDYTNDWKAREEEARKQVAPLKSMALPALREQARQVPMHSVKELKGQQSRPALPEPIKDSNEMRIGYSKLKDDIQDLANELLENPQNLKETELRRKVGEASFDYAFEQKLGRRPQM